MRRHLNVFVTKNFPDVSEMDFSFYPSDQALSSLMYRVMILHVLRLVKFNWQYTKKLESGVQNVLDRPNLWVVNR